MFVVIFKSYYLEVGKERYCEHFFSIYFSQIQIHCGTIRLSIDLDKIFFLWIIWNKYVLSIRLKHFDYKTKLASFISWRIPFKLDFFVYLKWKYLMSFDWISRRKQLKLCSIPRMNFFLFFMSLLLFYLSLFMLYYAFSEGINILYFLVWKCYYLLILILISNFLLQLCWWLREYLYSVIIIVQFYCTLYC